MRLMLPTLYAGASTLGAPALRLMLRQRAGRGKEIAARLGERRGIDATPRPAGRLLWLHCASVGETVSVLPVLAPFLGMAGDAHVLFTTGTVTAAELLAARLPELGLAARVLHRFVPLDVPAWVRRFLDHWRPDAAAFVESEVWPNLLAGCARRGIPTMLVNARMSDSSFRRWRRVPRLAARLLGGFGRVIAQSELDAERLRTLGALGVTAPGNLKFAAAALPVPQAELQRLRVRLAERPVWLAASTHEGEEDAALAVHAALCGRHPGLLTIVAPRHPARGEAIAAACGSLAVRRRSVGEGPPEQEGVWVADTMGELGLLYSLVGHAFVGGSLVAIGGHNPLEPARLGCAVAIGPHVQNCEEPVAVLERAGALTRVADAPALALWVGCMLGDGDRRRAMGEAGIAASRRFSDLPARVAAMLAEMLRRQPIPG